MQLFEHLHTLLDSEGENALPVRTILTGISILSNGTARDILTTAGLMVCKKETGKEEELSVEELKFILSTLNSSASFFGDPVMSEEDIKTLVKEVMGDSKAADEEMENVLGKVSSHPLFEAFLSAKGTVRYSHLMQ